MRGTSVALEAGDMDVFAFGLLAITTSWIMLGLVALTRASRTKRCPVFALGMVSVLKPLSGRDDDLEENLKSFFLQDYVRFELIFGVEDPRDPSVPIVRKLMREHPHIAAKLVVHGGTR